MSRCSKPSAAASTKVRVRRAQGRPTAYAPSDEGRLRLPHRPAQRRQVHAAEPHRRPEARHRLGQAADDADARSSASRTIRRRSDRLRRYAGRPPAAASDERAHGRRRARGDARSRRAVALVVDASVKSGSRRPLSAGRAEGRHDAGRPGAEQSRSRRQATPAAAHRSLQQGASVRRHRAGVGDRRHQRRRARTAAPRSICRKASRSIRPTT